MLFLLTHKGIFFLTLTWRHKAALINIYILLMDQCVMWRLQFPSTLLNTFSILQLSVLLPANLVFGVSLAAVINLILSHSWQLFCMKRLWKLIIWRTKLATCGMNSGWSGGFSSLKSLMVKRKKETSTVGVVNGKRSLVLKPNMCCPLYNNNVSPGGNLGVHPNRAWA